MRLIFVLHVYVNVALHGAAAYFTAGGLHICASRSLNVLVALHGLAGLLRSGRREGSRGRASHFLNSLVALDGLAGLLCDRRAPCLCFTFA